MMPLPLLRFVVWVVAFILGMWLMYTTRATLIKIHAADGEGVVAVTITAWVLAACLLIGAYEVVHMVKAYNLLKGEPDAKK